MRSCWIFGGAPVSNDFSVNPPDDAYIIAADKGYLTVKQMGLTANIALGDFDSMSRDIPQDCEVISVSAEKDDTDTMLAVKIALTKGYTDITIVGALGGRLDHTFANIQTLAYIREHGGVGRIIGETDTVELLSKGSYNYSRKDDMYLSIFAYTPYAIVTTTGTKYDITEYKLSNAFPLGVSNEIIEQECNLNVEEGQIIVIFSKK